MTFNPKKGEHFALQNAALGKGNTAATQIIIGDYNAWEFDISDDAVLDLEFPHSVDTSKDVSLHISWFVNEAYVTNSGEVQWQLDWSAVPHDETEAVDAPTHSGTLTTGDINIPTTAKTVIHTTNLTITAANIVEDDTLGLKLSRIALVAGNNPTAKPSILTLHVEYTPLNT